MRIFQNSVHILLILLMQNLLLPNSLRAEEPNPAGLTIQESLRVPVFYAAAFGFIPKTLDSYINNPMPFKMEARYITDKFSSRQNNQLWLNAMLTSNSREELRSIESALLVFSRLIKTDMYKGDRLVFDLNPVHGTAISINNVQLGVIKDLKFQSALVAIWFSDRQPSKKFAEEIRTPPTGKELEDFNALTMRKNQKSRFASLQTALSSPSNIEITHNTDSQSTEKPEIAKSDVKAKTPPKLQTPSVTAPKVENSSTNVAIEKAPQHDKKVGKKATQSEASSTSRRIAKSEPKQQPAKKAAVIQEKVAKVEQLSVVDQMFNSLRQDYQTDLKQYIEQNARPAPPFKVRKKPQGRATLKVSLANQNNKVAVANSELVSGEFDDELVEELHKSVKRLKSMPPIPQALSDQTISVEVSLDFDKCKRSMSTWICF